VNEYLTKIDEIGGMMRAIEHGYVQREIQNSAYETQRAIEKGDMVVVGVNKFTVQEEQKLDMLRVDPAVGEAQKARLAKLREERDNALVQERLASLRAVAQSDDNLMPPILACVEAYATLGEICDVMRDVFGEYKTSFDL